MLANSTFGKLGAIKPEPSPYICFNLATFERVELGEFHYQHEANEAASGLQGHHTFPMDVRILCDLRRINDRIVFADVHGGRQILLDSQEKGWYLEPYDPAVHGEIGNPKAAVTVAESL